jgi:hypothetical protein
MALFIDRLLQTELDIRSLPRRRRGRIDRADVLLLHLGEGGGILLAPAGVHGNPCRLTWRLSVPAGPFNDGPSTIDAERDNADSLAIAPTLAAVLAARQFAEVGQIAWRRLAASLTGPEATLARLVMARLRLLVLDATGGDLVPAMPDLELTLDVYCHDREQTPRRTTLARPRPGRAVVVPRPASRLHRRCLSQRTPPQRGAGAASQRLPADLSVRRCQRGPERLRRHLARDRPAQLRAGRPSGKAAISCADTGTRRPAAC